MSLPFSKFVPVSAAVQSPAFTLEKKNMILAMDNALIGTDTPYIEYSGASALNNFKKDFGSEIAEYTAMKKYFGFMSKQGSAPEKAIVVRWYKQATAPFVKCGSPESFAILKAITDGSFEINETQISALDFSSANAYSDIASLIETGLTSAGLTGFTCVYSSLTGGFIITGGTTGLGNEIVIGHGSTGTDLFDKIGLDTAKISKGVNAETFAELCDRVYNMNLAGFSLTTLESITDDDVINSVAFINSVVGNQSVYTKLKLVLAYSVKATVEALATTLSSLSYTGFVLCYDPNEEMVNILDCAIGAPIDYEAENSALNFNFQPAVGYTPITEIDEATDYQAGLTNLSLAEELDSYKISYVYSVGIGSQKQVCYGMGLMAGSFGTEDVQINESWLESDLQTRIVNGFISLDKVKLQGQDATDMMSSIIAPSFTLGQQNGTIAKGGTLSDNDKLVLSQTFGADSINAVEKNGYYYQIQPLTNEDIANRRVRIKCAYLCAGVVNEVRIINNIYGA